ncbi:hypothetical protein D3C86_1477290 [compost metagenome]
MIFEKIIANDSIDRNTNILRNIKFLIQNQKYSMGFIHKVFPDCNVVSDGFQSLNAHRFSQTFKSNFLDIFKINILVFQTEKQSFRNTRVQKKIKFHAIHSHRDEDQVVD